MKNIIILSITFISLFFFQTTKSKFRSSSNSTFNS